MKQLGCTHYVYQHSDPHQVPAQPGVMHLAGEHNHLIGSGTDLRFDAVKHLCVQIAGLYTTMLNVNRCIKYLCFFLFILQQIMTIETYFLDYLSAPLDLVEVSKGCSLN